MKITAYHNGNLDSGIKEGHLYFTNDKDTANWYGEGNLYQVKLNLENPIIFDSSEDYDEYIESLSDWSDVLNQGYDSIICNEEPKYYVSLLPKEQVLEVELVEPLQESNQEIRTVDLTSMFDHNPTEKEARSFVNSLLKQKGTYSTASEGWFITLNMRSKARSHIVHPKEMTYGTDYEWDKDTKIRHNKAAIALESILGNAIYDNKGAKTPRHPKHGVECYYNFLVNIKFNKTIYRFIIDTEKYTNDTFTDNEKIVHMYNIHEDKNTPPVVENYFIPSKNFTEGVFTNSITLDNKSVKHNIKNYKGNNMKEDLTFFKDDEDRNKNGSRVKNPNRVFAAKKAHKTHGVSYKQAYKRGNDMKKDRASMVVEELEKFIESKIEQNNPVNLYAEINSEQTNMGFQIKFDENNYSLVDITTAMQDKEGVGAYQLEVGDADKIEASAIFQSLMNDLNSLLSTFDNDFEAVLKKNGVVRRVD